MPSDLTLMRALVLILLTGYLLLLVMAAARRLAAHRARLHLHGRRTSGGRTSGVLALTELLTASQRPAATRVQAITQPFTAKVHLPAENDVERVGTASLDYDASDPYAITLSCTVENATATEASASTAASTDGADGADGATAGPVHFAAVFGRDLLVDVFTRHLAGDGMVRMRRSDALLSIGVQTDEHGAVLLFLPWRGVVDFYVRTMSVVKVGEESSHLSVDEGLHSLLAEHSGHENHGA